MVLRVQIDRPGRRRRLRERQRRRLRRVSRDLERDARRRGLCRRRTPEVRRRARSAAAHADDYGGSRDGGAKLVMREAVTADVLQGPLGGVDGTDVLFDGDDGGAPGAARRHHAGEFGSGFLDEL
jgi:hypothetical protein